MSRGWHGERSAHSLAARGIKIRPQRSRAVKLGPKFDASTYNYDYYDAESTRRKAICKFIVDIGGKNESKKIDAMKGMVRHLNGRMNLSKKMNLKASKIYAADAEYVRGMLGRAERRMENKTKRSM